MKIRKVEVKTFLYFADCGQVLPDGTECKGELTHTGVVYPTSPQQYPYTCSLCGHTEVLTDYYPKKHFEKF